MKYQKLITSNQYKFCVPIFFFGITFCLVVLTLTSTTVYAAAEDSVTENNATNERHATAVALNYCRASFHRIRKNPSKRVLIEEQEQILNNLNLGRIDDEEVVKLYTSVLDEIGRIQIADSEREVIRDRYGRSVKQHVMTTAMSLGAQLATAQYAGAVSTGAASWWDYRALGWQRDFDSLRVEKERMVQIVDKSSQFLDIFWKLSRKRNIPDHWLVRQNDLDALETAMNESDLTTRLRILQRMEKFMECYPPYWYYVGRVQQRLGKIEQAEATYEKMAQLGAGHFRKDEMLAAGLTNLALIQDFHGNKQSHQTATLALQQSTLSWQANLVCAGILERHERHELAEDSILRNLDLHLEERLSRANLVAFYYRSQNIKKLSQQLHRVEVVRLLPKSLLIPCAALLQENEELPTLITQQLSNTLQAQYGNRLGFQCMATPEWQLQTAGITLKINNQEFSRSTIQQTATRQKLQFRNLQFSPDQKVSDSDQEVVLTLQYPASPVLHLKLREKPAFHLKNLKFSQPFQIVSIDVEETIKSPEKQKARTFLTSNSKVTEGAVKVQAFKPVKTDVKTIQLSQQHDSVRSPIPPAPESNIPQQIKRKSREHLINPVDIIPDFRPAPRR